MGREVKKVDMDFDWPMNKTWWGYTVDVPYTPCEYCDGSGKKNEKMCWVCYGDGYAMFGRIDPPSGNGFQMWENVSEGSPISPVFKTAEELARWLADSGASSFGSMTATYDEWLAMIKQGYAPSMVMTGNHLESGVSATARLNSDEEPT